MNVFRNLTISVAFYGKFATIWWKKNFSHVNNRCWLVYASSIGKHLVKKGPIWEEDFASIFWRIWRKLLIFLLVRAEGIQSWQWDIRKLFHYRVWSYGHDLVEIQLKLSYKPNFASLAKIHGKHGGRGGLSWLCLIELITRFTGYPLLKNSCTNKYLLIHSSSRRSLFLVNTWNQRLSLQLSTFRFSDLWGT